MFVIQLTLRQLEQLQLKFVEQKEILKKSWLIILIPIGSPFMPMLGIAL